MIAWAGLERWRSEDCEEHLLRGRDQVLGLQVHSRCPLGVSFGEEVFQANIKCKFIQIR